MRYLILFGVFVALAVAAAVYCFRRLGSIMTLIIGILLSIATTILFFVNKSDSVADTFIEKLADFSPPLITGSVVIGWWIGYALMRLIARRRG